jgi:hypothetical protein
VSATPHGWTVPAHTLTHGRQLTLSDVGPRTTPTGTTYNTRQTISSNNVTVSGNIYNKGLTITGSGVTVEDCIIRDDVGATSYANLRIQGANATVRYCEIDNESLVYYGVQVAADSTEANPTRVYRNWIHHGGFGLAGEDATWWEFTENYVDDLVAPDPPVNEGEDIWHVDAVIAWGSHMVVARNKLLVPLDQTGVINIGTWSGSTSNVDDVVIDSNYLAGAGYVFYLEEKGTSYDITNMVVTDNDIGDDYYTNGGFYGVWYQGFPPTTPPTVTGNRLVDASNGGAYLSDVVYFE